MGLVQAADMGSFPPMEEDFSFQGCETLHAQGFWVVWMFLLVGFPHPWLLLLLH